MSMQTNAVLLKAGILLLIAGGLPAAMSGQTSVKVVNTPNVHVTNTPSVTVANTPSVTVANTPTVNVGNTPNVNVANTPTKPVFVSNLDDPGRIAYQSIVSNTGKCSGASCFWEFGSPAPGHRVVIQHVSGLIGFNGSAGTISVSLNNGSGFPVSSFFGPLSASALFSSFDQTVLAYFDSSQIIEVQVDLIGSTFPGGNISEIVSLSGYELDCNAAPCAPIAH